MAYALVKEFTKYGNRDEKTHFFFLNYLNLAKILKSTDGTSISSLFFEC